MLKLISEGKEDEIMSESGYMGGQVKKKKSGKDEDWGGMGGLLSSMKGGFFNK